VVIQLQTNLGSRRVAPDYVLGDCLVTHHCPGLATPQEDLRQIFTPPDLDLYYMRMHACIGSQYHHSCPGGCAICSQMVMSEVLCS
jgi:hypothetical protein